MTRAALALLLLAASARAAPPETLSYTAAPQPFARIEIKHTPLTARLALGFDRALLLNLAPAARANLKPFPIIGKATVKNRLIPGGEATLRGNLYDVAASGHKAVTVPTLWVDKDIADDADGVLSVFALNADHVVIVQPAAPAGGSVYSVPRDGRSDSATTVTVGGEKLRVIFDLRSPHTIMSAVAARAVETAGLVRRGGTVGLWEPFPRVALPFETLVPTPGATLLGLPLLAPAARVTEARAKELDAAAHAGTSTAEDQEDAIVVTAARKQKKGNAWVIIGRDVTSRCSRIELDRPGARWVMTCNFGTPS